MGAIRGRASNLVKLGLVFLAISSFVVALAPPSWADEPIVVSLRQSADDEYELVVTIVHRDPSPEHYVDRIQFSADYYVCSGSTVGLGPQEEEEFVVTRNCLFPCHLSNPKQDRQVRVRASCTVHG